ncbi:uncharacterized protein [Nicotiana sylvestris]|uniref:uncharacterized protein n=1 Tax=Nicotiana sylvestris TaxID=4096 RepID=UPI00388CD807
MYYVNGLKYSLLSVSQICDKGNKVEFLSKICTVTNQVTGEVVLVAKRYKNIYVADFESLQSGDLSCLKAVDDDAELWYRRLGHTCFSLLNKLIQKDLVHGLPMSKFKVQKFCNENDITHNFSTPKTPQQNEVVERKNRTLEEMARTMLIDSGIVKNFWAEAVNTACYLVNRCMIRSLLNKTPYELLNGRKPELTHLRTSGCKCYVLNNRKDQLGKFDAKNDEGIFLGYSSKSKAYKIYNKRTQCVEESVYVIFDESYPSCEKSADEDQDGEPLLVPGEVIDMINGKANMMSQVKELSEDNDDSSSMEPGNSIATTEAEERMVDVVQGTPLAPDRRTQENQSNPAPRAWYERLLKFLLENGFKKGKIDNTMFLKKWRRNLLIVQVYVDDIIFRATTDSLCDDFAKPMGSEFEMSMMGELNFFLGLQVKQSPKGTFICQQKYIRELLKRFDIEASKCGAMCKVSIKSQGISFEAAKRILRYLKETQDMVLFYPSSDSFNLIGYADAYYAGYLVDRKRLIEWLTY